MALTDLQVRKAKPETKDYKISDGNGLYLLVTSAGGKLWRWKYRFNGKEKLMTIGAFPVVTLSAVP